MTSSAIQAVPATSFSAAKVRERADIQRLLKHHIDIVSPDTLIISEEFASWDTSARRIDLLGIDRDANLVVIELKRDDTGAHMELQALRYAAMIARMTFDQTVTALHAYMGRGASPGSNGEVSLSREDARGALLQFLDWDEPDESSFAQEVRIVLVAADFSRELTTSVMWLNERDIDIRCVQLQPYQLGDQLLLQVDQVIPLREASEYQVQVREKARRERASVEASTKDWTRFDLQIGTQRFTRLPKRRLIFQVIRHLIADRGVSPDRVASSLAHPRPWVRVEGIRNAEGFRKAVDDTHASGGPKVDFTRFMCDDDELLHAEGNTYAVTKMWGTNTLPSLQAIRAQFPDVTFEY